MNIATCWDNRLIVIPEPVVLCLDSVDMQTHTESTVEDEEMKENIGKWRYNHNSIKLPVFLIILHFVKTL